MFPIEFLWLFIAAMVISSIGFKNYVWFISLGYGFSIAGEGLLMMLLYGQELSLGTVICCILFVIYGCRLGGYLAIREFKSSSYKKNMVGEIKDGKTVPFGVKIAIWVTCALLYVTQVSGVFYRLHNGSGSDVWTYIGAAIMLGGIVRCPNYLGEMIFWTGVLISGIGGVSGIGQWIIVAVGYVGIIFVMFSGARRLEIRQNKNYGTDPEYQKYVTTVPILLPFIPLYSVEKHKWLVA